MPADAADEAAAGSSAAAAAHVCERAGDGSEVNATVGKMHGEGGAATEEGAPAEAAEAEAAEVAAVALANCPVSVIIVRAVKSLSGRIKAG